MKSNKWRFAIPKDVILEILNDLPKDHIWTLNQATLSVMINLDNDVSLSESAYASRFNWSKSKVHRNLSGLIAQANEWRNPFNKAENDLEKQAKNEAENAKFPEPMVNRQRTDGEPKIAQETTLNADSESTVNRQRTDGEPHIKHTSYLIPHNTSSSTAGVGNIFFDIESLDLQGEDKITCEQARALCLSHHRTDLIGIWQDTLGKLRYPNAIQMQKLNNLIKPKAEGGEGLLPNQIFCALAISAAKSYPLSESTILNIVKNLGVKRNEKSTQNFRFSGKPSSIDRTDGEGSHRRVRVTEI